MNELFWSDTIGSSTLLDMCLGCVSDERIPREESVPSRGIVTVIKTREVPALCVGLRDYIKIMQSAQCAGFFDN